MRKTNYKLPLLLIGSFLLYAVSALATINYTSDVASAVFIDYNSSTTAVTDSVGDFDFALNDATPNLANRYIVCDGANDYLSGADVDRDSPWTITFWANTQAFLADDYIFEKRAAVANRFQLWLQNTTGFALAYSQTGKTSALMYPPSGPAIDDSSWTFFTITSNGTHITTTLNNTYNTSTASVDADINTVANWTICAYQEQGSGVLAGSYWSGWITQWYIFNRSLSQEELAAHSNSSWNSGTFNFIPNFTYTPSIGGNNTFTVNVNDLYNDGDLQDANVTFFNTTEIVYSTLTDASGNAVFSTQLTQTSWSFNVTKTNYTSNNGTINANLTTSSNITQAVYTNATIYKIITSQMLDLPFNITVQGGKGYTLDGTTTAIYLRQGQNNLTMNKTGWYNLVFYRNVSPLSNTTMNATGAYDAILNITPRNITNNASITDATVYNLTQTTYSYSENYNTSVGYQLFYLLQNLTYDFIVDPTNHENKSYEDVNLTTNYTTYYTYHYTKNSISFRFYDEINFSTISWATINVELISDIYSTNTSTSNGTLYIDLLMPTEYFIRYRATGYGARFYPITIEENYHYEVNLSLLANTSGSDVTINVYDTLGQKVEGAYVKIQKYDVLTNSYLLNQVGLTNFEGQTNARLILNEEFYKFIIEYEGSVVYSTEPTYVYSTTLNFYIPIDENYFDDYLNERELGGNITHSYTTHTSTFTYNDQNNAASGGCVYVYEYPALTLYNSSCGVTPSATIYVGINNATENTYIEKGYITYAGVDYLVATNTVTYTTNAETGATGYILAVLLIMVVVFVGFWSIEVALLLGSLVPLLFSVTGIFNLSYAVTIPVFAIGVVLTFIVGSKQ